MSLGCCAREVLLTAESSASDAVLGGSGLCGYYQTGNCEGHPHGCTDKRPEPGTVTKDLTDRPSLGKSCEFPELSRSRRP